MLPFASSSLGFNYLTSELTMTKNLDSPELLDFIFNFFENNDQDEEPYEEISDKVGHLRGLIAHNIHEIDYVDLCDAISGELLGLAQSAEKAIAARPRSRYKTLIMLEQGYITEQFRSRDNSSKLLGVFIAELLEMLSPANRASVMLVTQPVPMDLETVNEVHGWPHDVSYLREGPRTEKARAALVGALAELGFVHTPDSTPQAPVMWANGKSFIPL